MGLICKGVGFIWSLLRTYIAGFELKWAGAHFFIGESLVIPECPGHLDGKLATPGWARSKALGLIAQDERLRSVIEPVVDSMGYELVRIAFGGAGRPTLQIMAERPDGTMEVGDCEALSRELSTIMDVEDVVKGEYVLEVSSPGLDRPLTRLKDFETYKGRDAKIELAMAQDGQRRFRGILGGLEEGRVVLNTDDQSHVFEIEDIRSAKLVMTDALFAEAAKKASAKKLETDG